MDDQVIGYRLHSAQSPGDLAKIVLKSIKQGWEPRGAPVFGCDAEGAALWAQAMVIRQGSEPVPSERARAPQTAASSRRPS